MESPEIRSFFVPQYNKTCDYMYVRNFLGDKECQEVIKFFDKHGRDHIADMASPDTYNALFQNRVVWYTGIPDDQKSKLIMKDCKYRIIEYIKQLYKLSYIHSDGIMINIWPANCGGMAPHFDNQNFDDKEYHTPWREYSAVIYLNDDYEGGEFYFAKSGWFVDGVMRGMWRRSSR